MGGVGYSGALGHSSDKNEHLPREAKWQPQLAPGETLRIAAGLYHSAAFTSQRAWLWGRGSGGRLGQVRLSTTAPLPLCSPGHRTQLRAVVLHRSHEIGALSCVHRLVCRSLRVGLLPFVEPPLHHTTWAQRYRWPKLRTSRGGEEELTRGWPCNTAMTKLRIATCGLSGGR